MRKSYHLLRLILELSEGAPVFFAEELLDVRDHRLVEAALVRPLLPHLDYLRLDNLYQNGEQGIR